MKSKHKRQQQCFIRSYHREYDADSSTGISISILTQSSPMGIRKALSLVVFLQYNINMEWTYEPWLKVSVCNHAMQP